MESKVNKLNVFTDHLEHDAQQEVEEQTEWSCWINAGWSQF